MPCACRWWEEDDQIVGGHLYLNLPLGEFSYPSTGYFSKQGIILGMYANGPVGTLLDQTPAQRVEHVLANASKVHPQMRTEFENAFGVWWKKAKYSEGGYATGAAHARHAQLSTMEDRLLIGSAADLPVLRTGLAGRRCRRRLADREDAARESDESLERSEARSQKFGFGLRALGSSSSDF